MNPNHRLIRLWLLEKRLQLIVCTDLVQEYLGVFADVLGMDDETVTAWQQRFEADSRSTLVNLGKRYTESRDPDDNLLLATAQAGRAHYRPVFWHATVQATFTRCRFQTLLASRTTSTSITRGSCNTVESQT